MKLYVIRHAVASDRSADGRDESRSLTPEGREQFARAVASLHALGVQFDLLLHSPLVRAVQTAELCAPLLRGPSAVEPELAHSAGDSLLQKLRGESVALVGHEPWQSELVAWLVTGRRELGARFALERGAVAALRGIPAPGGMALEFHAPPSLFTDRHS